MGELACQLPNASTVVIGSGALSCMSSHVSSVYRHLPLMYRHPLLAVPSRMGCHAIGDGRPSIPTR